jgi:hypothetical protein
LSHLVVRLPIDLHNIGTKQSHRTKVKLNIHTKPSNQYSTVTPPAGQKTMTTSSLTPHKEKRMTASIALLNMKRAFPKKQTRYQKEDRTAPSPPPPQHHQPISPAPVLWTPSHPMSRAPVLWTPALTPAAARPRTNTRSTGQVTPVVLRDLDHYILVAPGLYRRLSHAGG